MSAQPSWYIYLKSDGSIGLEVYNQDLINSEHRTLIVQQVRTFANAIRAEQRKSRRVKIDETKNTVHIIPARC